MGEILWGTRKGELKLRRQLTAYLDREPDDRPAPWKKPTYDGHRLPAKLTGLPRDPGLVRGVPTGRKDLVKGCGVE